MSSPNPTSSAPGSEFGHQQPIIANGRRYLVLSQSTMKMNSAQPNQPQTKKPVSVQKASSSASPLYPAPNLSKDDEFEPVDQDGKPRSSIHGIPIIKNPQTNNFTMIFAFPALLGPSITSDFSIELPKPTSGGTIHLLLSNPDLAALLNLYQKLLNRIQAARNALAYTHYFGIPLGPVHPMCYDFTDGEKKVIDKIGHYNDEGTNKADYRFAGTKFTESETSHQLAANVIKMHKKMGLDTTHLLDMVLKKHDNYNTQATSASTPDVSSDPSTPTELTDEQLHSSAAMPIPKLHCTILLLKILSLDELNLVTSKLSSLQQVIYDSLGGTSVSLRIKKTQSWAMNKDGSKSRHFVALLAEAYKAGKINPSDHISTGSHPSLSMSPSPGPEGGAADGDVTKGSENGDGNGNEQVLLQNQQCPRLAVVVGILANALLKAGIVTPTDLMDQKIGTEVGQRVGVSWHMTFFNNKYATWAATDSGSTNSKEFLLDVALCKKGASAVSDWGQHRAPCINLYRMSSRLSLPKKNSKWYFLENPEDPNAFFQFLPARHKVWDHYVIERSLPLP